MTMIPRQHLRFSPAPRVNVFLHCSNTQDFSLFISHILSSKIWNTTYHASNASFFVNLRHDQNSQWSYCSVLQRNETIALLYLWCWRILRNSFLLWKLTVKTGYIVSSFARVKIYSPGHEAVFLSPCKQAGGILSHSISVTRRKRQISDVNILTFKLWI